MPALFTDLPRSAKWKVAAVAFVLALPWLVALGAGWYYVWLAGYSFAYWGLFAGTFLLSYGLGWYWLRNLRPATALPRDADAPFYWTERDHKAWDEVRRHAALTEKLTVEDLANTDRYAADAKELALKVAAFYVPGVAPADPFEHLTIPEVFTCGELVSDDMATLVRKYLPGSETLSIRRYKQAGEWGNFAAEYYPKARNLYWLASAFVDPIQAAVKVLGTKAGLAPVFERLQGEAILWFHREYVHKLGRYLIELNSGRLRVGAKRYRELMAQHGDPSRGAVAPAPAPEPAKSVEAPAPESKPLAVTLAVVGPVKAGKSTLINTMLGDRQAETGVVPLTNSVTRYVLRQEGLPEFDLLDTAGYGNEGPNDQDLAAAVLAAGQADVLILATPANNAARRPEVEFLTRLRTALDAQPNLKMPPVVLALTKADQLSPKAEWAPPYDWRRGTRRKEEVMRDAVAAAREAFGETVGDIVPVSSAHQWGVRDALLAAASDRLGEARGVSLLRALHAEAVVDAWRRGGQQLMNVLKTGLGVVAEILAKPKS